MSDTPVSYWKLFRISADIDVVWQSINIKWFNSDIHNTTDFECHLFI